MSAAHHLDRAVQSAEDDLLERGLFIERLGNALVAKDNSRATGVVVGITGEWGSGKSSILNLAARHLEDDRKAVVVRFDPWVVSGRDDLIGRLLMQVAKKLGKDKRTKSLAISFLDYLDALTPAIDTVATAKGVPGLGKMIKGVSTLSRKKLSKLPDLHHQREELKKILAETSAPIVVMIDELDRLDDGEIRAMAQFVRAVGDFDRISYLLAYDQRRVAEALGDGDSDRGLSYLEKIVQYQIPLPILFSSQLTEMLDKQLLELETAELFPSTWRTDPRRTDLVRRLIPGVLNTPRDLKRFIGMLRVQASMLGEVDIIDLMAWCALMTKAPQVVGNIRDNPSRVGVLIQEANSFSESLKNKNIDDYLKDLGLTEKDEQIVNLIRFIFPKLNGETPSKVDRNPDCLCFRRPMIILLNYGLLPWHYSRAAIRRFLSAGYDGRSATLQQAIADNSLDDLIARFGEVYGDFERLDHRQIWLNLARYIDKNANEGPWPDRITPFHNLGRRFLSSVLHNQRTADHLVPHLRGMVDALENQGDLHILPDLIAELGRAPNRPPLLSREEAQDFEKRSFYRMVRGLKDDPHLIGRLLSPTFFFDLSRERRWPEDCKASLTDLAQGPRLDSIVLLFSGCGRVTDVANLKRLLDLDIVYERAKVRSSAGFDSDHPSLRMAYDTFLESYQPPD